MEVIEKFSIILPDLHTLYLHTYIYPHNTHSHRYTFISNMHICAYNIFIVSTVSTVYTVYTVYTLSTVYILHYFCHVLYCNGLANIKCRIIKMDYFRQR